jgi:hypothetical protein
MPFLCVSGFQFGTSAEDVRRLLSPFGVLLSFSFRPAAANRRTLGSGLVEMAAQDAATLAAELNGISFAGGLLVVREVVAADGAPAAEAVPPPAQDNGDQAMRRPALNYSVVLVESVPPPQGDTEQEWHRYVLEAGRSRIVGIHCGSYDDVTAYATECAANFNARSLTGKNTLALMPNRRS